MDYGFWFGYLVPMVLGFAAGWVLRGEHEVGRQEIRDIRREAMRRELERAKLRHPAYKQGYYEERLFDE